MKAGLPAFIVFQLFLLDQNLFKYLSEFISENRLANFQKIVEHRTKHISFVIEDLFQPHNASAVLRSCDCFGIQDVHIIENTNTYTTDKNIALGAGKWVNVHKYNEVENVTLSCLTQLKKKGYKIVATTPHKEDFTCTTIPLEEPLAVVFGKEMEGISDTVIAEADYFMKIPMYGFTESLNISVAAAITAQNLYERLTASDAIPWRLNEEQKQEVMFEWMTRSIKDSASIIDRYYKTLPNQSQNLV